jgi:hypothetical protein
MARWLLLVVTLLGFGLVFIAKSPALLGFGLLLGVCGFVGFVFALAAERISANARPEASMVSGEDFSALKRRPPAPAPRPASRPRAASAPDTDADGSS